MRKDKIRKTFLGMDKIRNGQDPEYRYQVSFQIFPLPDIVHSWKSFPDLVFPDFFPTEKRRAPVLFGMVGRGCSIVDGEVDGGIE